MVSVTKFAGMLTLGEFFVQLIIWTGQNSVVKYLSQISRLFFSPDTQVVYHIFRKWLFVVFENNRKKHCIRIRVVCGEQVDMYSTGQLIVNPQHLMEERLQGENGTITIERRTSKLKKTQ